MVDLCKPVDPSMTEGAKVKHNLKVLDNYALQMLLAKIPQTIAQVVYLCRSFEHLRKQRALNRQVCAQAERLSILAATYKDYPTLYSRKKDFMREEVAFQVWPSVRHGTIIHSGSCTKTRETRRGS